MTTRPVLDTTPEDFHTAKWMTDVTKFVEDLVGDELIPASPEDIKIEPQANSVKVSWRAVVEVGISEYQVFRGDDKNFSAANAELVATIAQAVEPVGTTINYNDPEAFTDKFYFVRAVKGLRRPKIVGTLAGFGVSVTSGAIGSPVGGGSGGTISGFRGTPGSMLFVNDAKFIDEDNGNFFYSEDLKGMVIGPTGLFWGNRISPDVVLIRQAANILALKRGSNAQSFRIYEQETPSGSADPITATLLTSGSSESDSTGYATASVSPGSDKLILAIVNGLRLAVAANGEPTAAGNGLTWVPVATISYFHGGDADRTRMTVFRAMGSSPSPGAVTFTFPETQARATFSIVEFENMDIGGPNGADAIVQVVISAEATVTVPTATLSAFQAPDNATFGATGWSVGDPTVAPGAGFVELSEDRLAPNGTGLQTQFRNDPDTTVNVTYAPAVRTVIFGIEIKNSVQPGTDTFLELSSLGTTGRAEVLVDDATVGTRGLAIGTRAGGGDLIFITGGVTALTIGTDQKSTFAESVLIDGATDSVQLTVRGHSTQTSDIMLVEDDALAKRFSVEDSGITRIEGTFGFLFEPDQIGGLVGPTLHMGTLPLAAVSTAYVLTRIGTTVILNSDGLVRIDAGGTNPAVSVSATQHIIFVGSTFWSATSGPTVLNQTTSKTNPVFAPDRLDPNTGIGGGVGDGSVTVVCNSVERATFYESGSSFAANHFVGAFTSDGSSNIATGTFFSNAILGAAGDNSWSHVRISGGSIVTSGAGDSGLAATLYLAEPNVTLTPGDASALMATLYIASAPTEGTSANYALFIDNGDARFDGAVAMFANSQFVGPLNTFTFGSGVNQTHAHVAMVGAFISSGISNHAERLFVGGQLTGFNADTVSLAGYKGSANIVTQGASNTIVDVAQMILDEPNITVGAGPDIITNAATLIITGAPSEGTNNYAFLVKSGLTGLRGNIILEAADLGNDVPGRCVTIERNIHAADEGPAPGSVELEAADGVSAFLWADDDGDLRIHTAKATGSTGTPTVDANTAGFKLSPLTRDHFHFASRIGSFGVEFSAGGYTFSAADANLTQASTTVTIGTANHPYYAHAFLVAAAAGAASGGAGEVEIEVSGTSIDDNGVRTAADTEVIVADITAMATDQYFETVKKWIGTVTWTLQVAGGGTHTTFNADFNYGLAKYEDFGNMDFEITGFELTGRAGAADTGFNVELCEHRATGWTYSAAAFIAGLGTALVDVAAILSTESDLASGEEFAFKKLDLASQIAGSGAEGYIIRITTGANASVETMNITVTARLN